VKQLTKDSMEWGRWNIYGNSNNFNLRTRKTL